MQRSHARGLDSGIEAEEKYWLSARQKILNWHNTPFLFEICPLWTEMMPILSVSVWLQAQNNLGQMRCTYIQLTFLKDGAARGYRDSCGDYCGVGWKHCMKMKLSIEL